MNQGNWLFFAPSWVQKWLEHTQWTWK